MFTELRISQYIIIPISLALLVAMSGWYVSYNETQKLREIEIANYTHANNITSFQRFKSGFSSILILSDLIVGSDQSFLVESYLEQSSILNKQLRTFQSEDWCCDPEKIFELEEIVSLIEKTTLRSAVSESITNKEAKNELLKELDRDAIQGLEIIESIAKSQKKYDQNLKMALKKQTTNHNRALLRVWTVGIISLILLWWLISKTITKPIIHLSKAAEKALNTGHFKNEPSGPIELRGLNNSLERLANQLEKELESERIKIQEQEKLSRAQLWDVAHIDPLTRIANRNLFDQHFLRLSKNYDKNQIPFNVCILDINEFKTVTHMFGHLSGNNLLISIANILKEAINDESLVCRNVGDEFALIIKPALDEKQLDIFFNDIIHKCNRIAFSDEAKAGTQISIGIADYPAHGNNNETIYQAAQTAMFEAKRDRLNGSSWKQFHLGMDSDRIKSANLKDKIEKAIEENSFELYFQPVVDSARDIIVSAEALLRWPNGPSDVAIPEIISVAEESGLILKLSDFIVDEACKMLSLLNKENIPLSIAINVSPIQFRYQDLTELILNKSKQYNINPQKLTIEITESTFLDDIERTQTTIKILQAIGVNVSIDDFGTGYSCLSYLQSLSIDWLKIDKSFINTVDSANNNLNIVKAIIQMGHAMNIGIVAEGVETKMQSQLLTNLKCDRLQGYLISKPIKANNFLNLINNYKKRSN